MEEISQCKFIHCNKSTTLVGMLIMCGGRGFMGSLCTFLLVLL